MAILVPAICILLQSAFGNKKRRHTRREANGEGIGAAFLGHVLAFPKRCWQVCSAELLELEPSIPNNGKKCKRSKGTKGGKALAVKRPTTTTATAAAATAATGNGKSTGKERGERTTHRGERFFAKMYLSGAKQRSE